MNLAYLHCPTINSGCKLKLFEPCPNNSPGGTIRQERVALVHDKNASSGLWWIVICNSKFGGNKAK